jgi:hypothetical protein
MGQSGRPKSTILLSGELACVAISLSPTEELATKEASYARSTVKPMCSWCSAINDAKSDILAPKADRDARSRETAAILREGSNLLVEA